MSKSNYRIQFRTGEILIDFEACRACKNYACIKADRLFGTSVLRLQDGKPVAAVNPDEFQRVCNECLGCEIYCQLFGNKGLTIKLNSIGLEEYREVV
ncbi:MAG: hypothetical protein QXJ17_09130 [Nitrososphaeria archaeon]